MKAQESKRINSKTEVSSDPVDSKPEARQARTVRKPKLGLIA
jgi:hypothetical protein